MASATDSSLCQRCVYKANHLESRLSMKLGGAAFGFRVGFSFCLLERHQRRLFSKAQRPRLLLQAFAYSHCCCAI